MARIFELPITKGEFQVKGVVNGTKKEKFYSATKTKSGKEFRSVNFGVAYDEHKSVFVRLTGMPRENVYFSKREDNKTVTKPIPWANRYKFKEEGYGIIGVKTGLEKTVNENGKEVNLVQTLTDFDACEAIGSKLKDDVSVYIKGNVEFNSFLNKNGDLVRGINYVPNQVSLCQDVDFDEYAALDALDQTKCHAFKQHIIFMGIDKERENDKPTGRFVVSAKIVTYSDIIDAEFIIVDEGLASKFKKYLKPYNEVWVHGKIEVSHMTQTVQDDEDDWGTADAMEVVTGATKTEMIILGKKGTVDTKTYTEANVNDALAKIRASKEAEKNFNGTSNAADAPWGEDSEDEDSDW